MAATRAWKMVALLADKKEHSSVGRWGDRSAGQMVQKKVDGMAVRMAFLWAERLVEH